MIRWSKLLQLAGLLGSCYLLPASIHAQVAVTGTVTDPSGIPYSNASISFQLVPSGTNPCITPAGGSTCQAIASLELATLSAAGSFSVNLYCNSTCSPSIQPSGTQWQITVNEVGSPPPIGTGPQSFTTTVTITGATSLSATLSALAPALTTSASKVAGVIVVDGCTGSTNPKYACTDVGIQAALNAAGVGTVLIPPGTATLSNTITMTTSGQHLVCSGIKATTLSYTGTTNITAVLDIGTASDGSNNLFGISVNGCTISGNSHVTDAIRTRGVHRSDFSNNSLINVTEAGIHTFFAVTNRYANLHTSANEQAFTQRPASCIILDGPDTAHRSTDSIIDGIICEGVSGDGLVFNDTATMSVISGTSEGNGRGINCPANCGDLRIYAPDLEANTTEDLLINGTASDYGGTFGSTTKIHVGTTGNFVSYALTTTSISTIDSGGLASGIAPGCGGILLFNQIGQSNFCGVSGASYIYSGDSTAVIAAAFTHGGTSVAPNAAGFTNVTNVAFKEIGPPVGAANFEMCWGDSAAHALKCNYNNGTAFNQTQTIASGTATMTTAAIASGACGTTVTVSATNVLTTDAISWSFSAAPSANPAELVVSSWPTANNTNFQYCNPTAASVTPAAATLNWRVVR